MPLGTFEFKASAATSGKTGNCTWTLEGTVLTISGRGAMGNYDYYSNAPWGTAITSVVIDDGVTTIGDYAFYECENLKTTVLPDSIRVIGESAFAYCSSIKNIVIPEKVDFIDDFTFRDCVNLQSIVIPEAMSGVAEFAFTGCSKLKDVYFCGYKEDSHFPIQEGNSYFTSYHAQWHYNIVLNNDYLSGDIDDSGSVDVRDLVDLAKVIADWEDVSINILAVDVNNDDAFDFQDVTHFARYLAGWDVEIS